MIEIASAVEDHVFDAGLQRALCDKLADLRRGGGIGALFKAAFKLAADALGSRDRMALGIVDDLGIDVL